MDNQNRRNFILGAGEQLVSNVPPPPKIPKEPSPYTPEEARDRLRPRLETAVSRIAEAPKESLVRGEAVAALTLHPQFLSKSAFPGELLAKVGLRAVGSKPDKVIPDKVDRKNKHAKQEATTTLFVAGQTASFEKFANELALPVNRIDERVLSSLTTIEDFKAVMPADRIALPEYPAGGLLQCTLYASDSRRDGDVLLAFKKYAEGLGFEVDLTNELFASGLCFVSARGPEAGLSQLAWFSLLRKVRAMPRLRPLLPSTIRRSSGSATVEIPSSEALDVDLKAAVFDVPLPEEHCVSPWVTSIPYDVEPFSDEDTALHGLCVTSGALFGPLDGRKTGLVPYRIDHHGVLGENEDFLGNLKSLQEAAKQYKLVNISFGPDFAIVDDDIEPFTAVIDDLLSDGKRLVFVAAGNSGELDEAAQLNRVQPPSDAVNAVGIGAADSRKSGWARASYSCVGPGRNGCFIKPDLLVFGGSDDEPFGCVGPGLLPMRYDTQGTSFASPSAMRSAGTIMALMGDHLTPMGVKAVMVGAAKPGGHDRREVGHGLMEEDLHTLLTSGDNEVKILFQGELEAGKYTSHQIPLPSQLAGLVEIEATLCYATPVDPHFPATYVQAGVEALFRPHSQRFTKSKGEDGVMRDSTTVESQSLFSQKLLYGARAERRDAHHWETVLKTGIRKRHDCLHQPTIELHYNRRMAGQPAGGASHPKVPYALVLTVRCKQVADLYNQVRSKYGSNLVLLAPRIDIPVRV